MVWTFDERQAALSSFATNRSITTFGEYSIGSGARQALLSAIDRIQSSGSSVGFVMMDLTTGQGVAYNADQRIYSASTIKGPYVASLVSQNPNALQSWSATISNILYYSSNEGYSSIRQAFGSTPFYAWCQKSGVDTGLASEYYTWYSARELAKLWVTNYDYFTRGGGSALGSRFEHAQISALQNTLGSQYKVQSKEGWYSGSATIYDSTSDGGIIYSSTGTYVVAIMSSIPENHSALSSLARAIDRAHSEMRIQA